MSAQKKAGNNNCKFTIIQNNVNLKGASQFCQKTQDWYKNPVQTSFLGVLGVLGGSLFHYWPKPKSRIKINLHIWDAPQSELSLLIH